MMDDVLSTLAKLTRNGQMSLPSELRRRWNVDAVLVMDRGDYAIIAPMPDDPMEGLVGVFAGPGPTSDEIRAEDRRIEAEIEERKYGGDPEYQAYLRRTESEAPE